MSDSITQNISNPDAMELEQQPNDSNKNTTETQSKKDEPKYIGLPNQGATCYMNSLLQSLFMTPEFRSAMYEWKYDENEHAKPEDCIPLQLQKLFASLQMKLVGSVNTKPLTKSFQWEESTSFEQHDIQEFSSVLFDAIEQSMKDPTKDSFINELYEGTTVNYVKCLECGYESSRPENFLNINLTVKNEFDKIYNDSLQKALQIYLKPEKLEGSNQYFCEDCNKKVDATKGTRFVKVPKLMSMIINRFSFDFIYMRRIKLDDTFKFPFILNMNDYINGYEGIKNKVSEESTPEYFETKPVKKTTTSKTTTKKVGTNKSTADTKTVAGKPVRSGMSSFLSEIRQKGKQNKQNEIDVVIYTKDVGDNEIGNPPPLTESNHIVEQFGKASQSEGTASANNSQPASQNDIDPKKKNSDVAIEVEAPRDDEELGVSPTKKLKTSHTPATDKMEEEETKEDSEKEKARKEERRQIINDFLQDGSLVYELYSILIHSGGAYGGHYYAYIKSFEDGKWYNFNDSSVSGLDQDEIAAKTFGGGGKSTNAYMLIYRQVETDQEEYKKLADEAIPEYLKKFIEEENKKILEVEMQRIEKSKNMNLKVYDKLDCQYINGHQDMTFREFQEKAFKVYNVTDKPENVRVRVYHPLTDNMQETFTGREGKTLAELKINSTKSFCIERKRDDQQFEEYDGDKIFFKVALHRENLPDLTEDTLKPEKIFVHKDATLRALVEQVARKFNLPLEEVRLVKKTQVSGFPHADLINYSETIDQKFSDLKVYEGSLIYVERSADQNAPLIWKEEFDRDAYNYKIKFNTPKLEMTEPTTEYPHHVMIDARKTLADLKREICKVLKIDENEILLRKGGRMGAEIKDLRQTVTGINFVNGSSVFVEFGRPTIIGEMRVYVSWALRKEDEDDVSTYDYQELFELIISGDYTAAEVKDLISIDAKKIHGFDWDPKKLRLREKVGNRLMKVYRNSALKSQGVSDKKQVAVEVLQEPETITPKEFLTVVRTWNPETLEISQSFEIIVDKTKSLKHFAEKIHEKNQSIPIENMMGCKVLGAWKFIKYDLLFQNWKEFDDDNTTVFGDPIYLNNDGTIIFIKDKTIKEKELTEEEKRKIGVGRTQHKASHTSGGTGYSSYNSEKSLKIHVKKKEVTDANGNVTGEGDKIGSQGNLEDAPIYYEDYAEEDIKDKDDEGFKPFF